jgi:hypothetical protein
MKVKKLIKKLRKFGSDSVVTLSNLKVTDCSGEHWIDVRDPVECFICGLPIPCEIHSLLVCEDYLSKLK